MKLNQAKKSLESSGMAINVDFSIDMNGKAFSVLSEGMYKDIVGTIVRELSSNAYDSHIAAGKPNVPFEVYCPTHFDPYFAVKDFGTGLRYYSYIGKIENHVQGESTIRIDGDIRSDVQNINTIVLNQSETAVISAVLYDTKDNATVIRVAGDYEGDEIQIEFDDALVLYSTYFRSTKEQSNDYIGAFGLGSKTPFAYTDNFIVTNRFNGIERTYNILTNQDNKPQINLMNTTATDDCNGLEVKIAVEPDDYQKFKDAIKKQLKYFDPLPEIQNESITFPTILYKGDHIIVCDELEVESIYNPPAFACVGNNAYEIHNVNSVIFKKYNTALRFNVGDVMVTASRESLKDDRITREAIVEKVTKAIEEYKKYVFDNLSTDSMNETEKAMFINEHSQIINFTENEVRKFIKNPHYMFTGRTVFISLSDWGAYNGITFKKDDDTGKLYINRLKEDLPLNWSEYNKHTGKVNNIYGVEYTINSESLPIIFVKDTSYAFIKKINYYMSKNIISNKEIYVVGYNEKERGESALNAIGEILGKDLDIVYLSSINLPKADPADRDYVSNTPVCRKITGGYYGRIHSPTSWTDVFTPLTRIDNSNAYAVPIHRNDVQFSYTDLELLKRISYAKNNNNDVGLTIDFESIELYGIPQAKYEKAISYGFTPLEKLIEKIKDELSIPAKVINKYYLENAYDLVESMQIIKVLKNIIDEELVNEHLENNDVKSLIRAVNIYEKRYADVMEMEVFSDYMKLPECPDNIKKIVDKIQKMRYNVSELLVLFDSIQTYGLYTEVEKQKALIDYINYAMKK